MHEDAAIRNADKLLTSGLSSRGDHGLVAQVRLFRILASSYFMYGCDPDLELSGQDFEKVQSFNISVDQWRLDHQFNAIEHLPAKGNVLYYHLARFQLNSVSLRGISAKDSSQLDMNWDRQEAANNAIQAAMSTVRLIATDNSLQNALIGLPIFTHAMIAVCASFLLKMAVVFGDSTSNDDRTLRLPRDLAQYGLSFHTKTALTNVELVVAALERAADKASQRHVARQVVTGLKDLLRRFSRGPTIDSFAYSQPSGRASPDPAVDGFRAPMSAGPGRQPPSKEANGRPSQSLVNMPDPQGGEPQVDYIDHSQDLFDLTGDLDWRFDDGFMLGIDSIDSGMPFL